MNNLKLLNIGGNSKSIPLPAIYQGVIHHLLDIDPKGNPDVLCDARKLGEMKGLEYDIIYCSHNLEHYYKHDVIKVLLGFKKALKKGGAIHIVVPDMMAVFKEMISKDMDIDDILYQSALGPIMISDVIYGYSKQIEESGQDFFAHKTGFSINSLSSIVQEAGFIDIRVAQQGYNIICIAFNTGHDNEVREIYGL